jgi:hypothetical protein
MFANSAAAAAVIFPKCLTLTINSSSYSFDSARTSETFFGIFVDIASEETFFGISLDIGNETSRSSPARFAAAWPAGVAAGVAATGVAGFELAMIPSKAAQEQTFEDNGRR